MIDSADEHTRRLAAAYDGPTRWFEELYRQARRGDAVVPWDSGSPDVRLAEWAREADGHGRRALVVGSGLGRDSEFVASKGFDTVAFDVSPTAVETARRRFPGTTVDYRIADLLDPPAEWGHAFDLVVESLTVQSLPIAMHPEAISQVGWFVARGGTLLVLASARRERDPTPTGPPWPLTEAEIDSFAAGGLLPVGRLLADGWWRAEFRR